MATEAHSISIQAGSGPVDLYTACALTPPFLKNPHNEKVFEAKDVIESGVTLEWQEMPNTDFYIVQWCPDTNFRGPMVRSEKVLSGAGETKTYDLTLGQHIYSGMKWKWRVFANNDSGCASVSSEVGAFSLEIRESWRDHLNSSNRNQDTFNAEAAAAPAALGQGGAPGDTVVSVTNTANLVTENMKGNCPGTTKITDFTVEPFMVVGDTKQCTVDWLTKNPTSASYSWNIDDSDVGLGSIEVQRATDRFIEFKCTEAASRGSFYIEFLVEDPDNDPVPSVPPEFEGDPNDQLSSSSSSSSGASLICVRRVEVEVLEDDTFDDSSSGALESSSSSSSSGALESSSSSSSSGALESSSSSSSSSSTSSSSTSSSSSSSSSSSAFKSSESSNSSSSSSSSSGDDRCVCIAVVTGINPETCCYTIEPQTLCMGEGYSFLINDSADPRWACPDPCSGA